MQIETPPHTTPRTVGKLTAHESMPVSVPLPAPHHRSTHSHSHIGSSRVSLSGSSSATSTSLTSTALTPLDANSSSTAVTVTTTTTTPTKFSLTFSAHHSIPDSVCRAAHHHPFYPQKGQSCRGSTSSKKQQGKVLARRSSEYDFDKDEDEDDWFYRSTTTGAADGGESSTAGDSLLLFREKQRRYFWVKQVRARERFWLDAEQIRQQERALELEFDQELERKRRRTKRKCLDDEALGKRKTTTTKKKKRPMMDMPMDDVEMVGVEEIAPTTNGYSRTMGLRSPSPSRYERRESVGASLFRGPPSEAAGFVHSGGIGQGSGRVRIDPDQAPPSGARNGNGGGGDVVKTSGGAGGRPRGLWRARGSGPVPTGETKTQIGGFVFGSGFLAGLSGGFAQASPRPASTSSTSSKSSALQGARKGGHGGFDDSNRVSGVKRSRSGSASDSDSSCSSIDEIRRVEQPRPAKPPTSSSSPSSSAPHDSTVPAKSFVYLGEGPAGASGGSTPLPPSTTPRGASPQDGGDDLLQKRKQGQLDDSDSVLHKRQRKTASSPPLPSPVPRAERGRSPTRTRLQHLPSMSIDSTAPASAAVGSKYVTRSKVMDTSSLAGCDPSVVESRRAATPSPPVPPPRSQWAEHEYFPQEEVKEPEVTFEDWEDLKEVWTRCLEMIDTEEPAEMLPLLRGIIHECSRFLQEYEDPSVLFLRRKRNPTPERTSSATGVSVSVGTSGPAEGDVEMLPSAVPPFVRLPEATAPAPNFPTSRRYHHPLCLQHEYNRGRSGTGDLPTAFHSILGTAFFFFGNLIGENPGLALEGEPRTSTVYHLYALDVFEVGENIPAKTLIGAGVPIPNPTTSTTTTTGLYEASAPSPSPYAYSYSNSNDALTAGLGAGADCCSLGMKEDWHMAVTWGRTLVSLAENLLERQRVVEERQRENGFSNDNPAEFLSEDFKVLGLAKGGYFEGSGGMGLVFNGIGQLVPSGSGNGLSAFHSPSSASSPVQRLQRMDDYWGHRPESSVATTAPPSTMTSSWVRTTTSTGSAEMYPSSSFLSPSFIAASTRAATSAATSTYAPSSSSSTTLSTTPTPMATPGAHLQHFDSTGDPDPRRFWQVDSPFVVMRSRMPPVTRRMSLGAGGGVSVDELMTLAMDQFSRGIFHMPRSGVVGGVGVGVAVGNEHRHRHRHREGGESSPGGSVHRRHRHHHHKRHRELDAASSTLVGSASSNAVSQFFSRASHLNTIATQVLFLAEKLDAPESRYKWGKYADSVFEQMRLEENPGAEVVTLSSESFEGALNDDVEEGIAGVMEDENEGGDEFEFDGEEMDVDGGGEGRHQRHRHKKHRRRHRHAGVGMRTTVRPPTSHPDFFLNNNSNPEILKARGRCCLVIGAALAEEELEGLLEDDTHGDADGGERVRRILESEDAQEVRERLEEAVKHLERAREVWRSEVWGPRRQVRESVRRRKAKEVQGEREMAMEVMVQREKEREEKERLRVEKQTQAEMKVVAEKEKERPVKLKRRGIARIAADNKRSAKAALRSGSPLNKGKERDIAGSIVFPRPGSSFSLGSAANTPALEKEAEAAMMLSPGTEVPPRSPSASDAGAGGSSGSDSSNATVRSPQGSSSATTSSGALGYFPRAMPVQSDRRDDDKDGEDDEEELVFRAEEEEEEMEEQDLAQLLAQALYMLGDLVFDEEKKECYRKAKMETERAGKAELVEEFGEEGMNVD